MSLATIRFRFYEELNDFLAPVHRKREFDYAATVPTETVKHAIEALGVPHTEVELILVDARSVGFEHRLRDGERVSVFPVFECFDISPLLELRPEPLRVPLSFIADSHLGGLARLLRVLGFDTLFDGGWHDAELIERALAERRVILSRDRELLKSRRVTHGCYLHARAPHAQLAELSARLQLESSAQPFTRCLRCNTALLPVDKAAVAARLPPSVAQRQTQFRQCAGCGRVYWPGSHWLRMQRWVSELLSPGEADAERAQPPPPPPAGIAGTGSR